MPGRDILHPGVFPILLGEGLRASTPRGSWMGNTPLHPVVRRALERDGWVVWSGIFREAIGDVLLEDDTLRLIVVNEEREEIERWLPSTPGAP